MKYLLKAFWEKMHLFDSMFLIWITESVTSVSVSKDKATECFIWPSKGSEDVKMICANGKDM